MFISLAANISVFWWNTTG